jgi:hypothetical protein
MLMRQVSAGEWMVESIVGVSLKQNAVHVTGSFDSVLERHPLADKNLIINRISSTLLVSWRPSSIIKIGYKQAI